MQQVSKIANVQVYKTGLERQNQLVD